MERVDIVITYSVEMPEVDEIYNLEDSNLIEKKLDKLKDEIDNDPFYFIERFGYDMQGKVTFRKE